MLLLLKLDLDFVSNEDFHSISSVRVTKSHFSTLFFDLPLHTHHVSLASSGKKKIKRVVKAFQPPLLKKRTDHPL